MAPVSFEQYGNQLREKGIYAFAMDRTFAGDLKRPTGYMELSSYQTETTPDLFKFFPNPGWEPTPGRDPDVAVAIVLGLSGLICLDVDVKKYPEQIQGMTAQEVRKFTQSLVPASWWNSGCYKQWTKSNGVHLVWRLPEGEDFTGKSEASTPQGLYKDISRVFKLENLQPVEGQYPPVYEFFHKRCLTVSPTMNYEPFGEVQSLADLEATPPKSFMNVFRLIHTPIPVKRESKPTGQYKRHTGSIDERRSRLTYEELFQQYAPKCLSSKKKGSTKYDTKCLTPFNEENTPSFYYRSSGDKKFKCFSTGHSGDVLDLEDYFTKGILPERKSA
jgi:hypothetical protein